MIKDTAEIESDKILFKVNEYTFRGNNSMFIFALLLNGDQLLQERICHFSGKFFPV